MIQAKHGSDCEKNSTACDLTFEVCKIFENPIPNQPKVHQCTCQDGAVKNEQTGSCEDKNECTRWLLRKLCFGPQKYGFWVKKAGYGVFIGG